MNKSFTLYSTAKSTEVWDAAPRAAEGNESYTDEFHSLSDEQSAVFFIRQLQTWTRRPSVC